MPLPNILSVLVRIIQYFEINKNYLNLQITFN